MFIALKAISPNRQEPCALKIYASNPTDRA